MVTNILLPLKLCEPPVSNIEVRKAGQNWSSFGTAAVHLTKSLDANDLRRSVPISSRL